MSIPQLNNPKKLSYNELRTQVSELARRMNILTEMRAVPVEYTAAAKFTFSGSGATLDVPRLDELIEQLEEAQEALEECETAIEECEAEREECDAALAEAAVTIDCLEDLVVPENLDGVASWFHQATSFRPDYGPPPGNPYPTCTKVISSLFSVRWITGNEVEFKRFNVAPPITSCAATGNISIAIDTELRNPPVGIPIAWSFSAGYSSVTQSIALNQTYYVYAAGTSLNENSYTQQYQQLGSFTISGTGEIVRTITTSVTTTEGDAAPCA